MTPRIKPSPRRGALPAAGLAALLLAGCASDHVGESWQCPLADTGTCDSVAAADPAVPGMDATRNAVLAEPLWRVRNTDRPAPPVEAFCESACDGGFDLLGWLGRLFGPETADGEEASAAGPVRLPPSEAPDLAALPAEPFPPTGPEQDAMEPAPAALPAEPDAGEIHAPGDLRTGEVVARIWIAPFVDADGVYREASHVRVVLEPAGWRLGR